MALSDWPDALKFSDDERGLIASYLESSDNERRAKLAVADAESRYQQFLTTHPELRGAEF